MTVEELIKKLQEYPGTYKVVLDARTKHNRSGAKNANSVCVGSYEDEDSSFFTDFGDENSVLIG